jgi:hypothetical protein
MMTPLRFQQTYQAEWAELESRLETLLGGRAATAETASSVSGARMAVLYRRACEHLALARARSYPAYVVGRLERITGDGHQLIHHRREFGFGRGLVGGDKRRRFATPIPLGPFPAMPDPVHLPVLDWLFGTFHLPAGRWPSGYGVHTDRPVPDGFLRQLSHPFRRRP